MRRVVVAMMAVVLSAVALIQGDAIADDNTAETFSPRLKSPRLAPLAKAEATSEQQAMLAKRPDYNIYTTLAHHVDLYNRWSPLGQFLLNGSSLPSRQREIIMLRMGWLCQSEYEWSQHARIAKGEPGLTDAEIHRIAEGPNAAGWSSFERTLLVMVDELRYEAMISDATWKALRAQFSPQQVMEALFTAAQYQLVSMALNSLGVQLDPILEDRLPTDVVLPRLASRPASSRLTTPRLAPLSLGEMTPAQRKIVGAQVVNGKLPNLYATLIHHPGLYGPRVNFGSYLQRESLLPPATRELLILRTAWLIRAEYEWAHHVSAAKTAGLTDLDIQRITKGSAAPGWSEEQAAVLQAADELRREAFIQEPTWKKLSKYYDARQLVDLIYTVGGYTMTGLAINSLGIQVEPGHPAFER
jgi:alkylhydroperoxidase family enzyme